MTRPPHNAAPLGFFAGLAIGIVLTAILTPKSGDDMRQSMKKKVDDYKSKAQDKADKAANYTESKLGGTAERIRKNRNKTDESGQSLDI